MQTKELTDSQKALRGLAGAMLLGMLSILVYAAQPRETGNFLTITGIGILLAGAFMFIGGTIGFLFGIPRSLQQEENNPSNIDSYAKDSKAPYRIGYRVNTNLEQISDWLTKILVGVTLIQANEINEHLTSLINILVDSLIPQITGAYAFILGLICYSTVLGFLFGYLWTRLFLGSALNQADQAAMSIFVEKGIAELRDETKMQQKHDAEAVSFANRQLNQRTDLPPILQKDLDRAIALASKLTKVQILNQTWQVRKENYKKNKPLMELTIPLFRAFINNDPENRYHRNHGELGFALKDKNQPDWKEAESELTKAIEIRNSFKELGWLYYEFNRAICRINNDLEFTQEKTSNIDVNQKILADLRIAIKNDELAQIIKSEPTINKWMSLNQIYWKDLTSD